LAVNTALSGKSAYIDFIGQKHAVKDFRRLTKTFGLFEAIIRRISGESFRYMVLMHPQSILVRI